MAVRIRMKKMGRTHRPFFRICAMDSRSPRDGRVIEELGFYDPMVKETDARAILRNERIEYWLGVGAKPSDNVRTLIKKYGSNGTHLEKQKEALDRLQIKPQAPPPVAVPLPKKEEPAAEGAAVEGDAKEGDAAVATEAKKDAAASDAPAEETKAEETKPAEEAKAEEAKPADDAAAKEEKKEEGSAE